MAKNKDQHIVPRGYIAQFADPDTPAGYDPYVWVYERGVAEPYRRAPERLTVKSYYYSWFGPDGERDDAADEVLQKFEGRGLPVLRRLGAGQDTESLTPQERYDFANFAALLTLRIPQFRDSVGKFRIDISRITGQLAAAHPGYLEQWAEGQYPKDGKPVPSKAVIARPAPC